MVSELKTRAAAAELTPVQKRFLAALSDTWGNVSAACTATGISRATHYNWRKDAVYSEAVEHIEERNLEFRPRGNRIAGPNRSGQRDRNNFLSENQREKTGLYRKNRNRKRRAASCKYGLADVRHGATGDGRLDTIRHP
jgi:hypothetical protein